MSRFLNPEFTKHYQLEVSYGRLGLFFGLLLLVFAVVWTLATPRADMDIELFYATKLFHVFSVIGYLLTIVWGTYLASSSVSDEALGKTWDFVRLSSLPPSRIFIGKLFGSTSLVWILTLLFVFPIVAISAGICLGVHHARPAFPLMEFIAAGFGWIFLSHGLGIIFAVHSMPARSSAIGATIIAFLLGNAIGPFLTQSVVGPVKATIHWFDQALTPLEYAAILLPFLGFWALVGAYRLLRRELLFRDFPVAWVAFLSTLSIFLAGHLTTAPTWLTNWPLHLGMVALIVTVIPESSDLARYRALQSLWKRRLYPDALRVIPLWPFSLLLIVAAMVWKLAVGDGGWMAVLACVSVIVFIVRDVAVLHAIALRPQRRFRTFRFFAYLACAYALVPLLFVPMAPAISSLFYPVLTKAQTDIMVMGGTWLPAYVLLQGIWLIAAFSFVYRTWRSQQPVAVTASEVSAA